MTAENRSVTFVVISGINFPVKSRKYLMNLVKGVVNLHGAKFIIGAGHTIAGKDLEQLLKLRLSEVPKNQREEAGQKFYQEMIESLDSFLPKIKDVNYHIVVAEKIYDRPIGYKILDELRKRRDDIRLSDNPETKMPIQLSGFGEMRVIVPRKQPWFYENITGLLQRLVNGFAMRTGSGKPPLILVGCTGTGSNLPYYKGVPCIAVPALHKLDDQLSTENMVGCVAVTITKDGDKFRIRSTTYDFRTALADEYNLALPDGLSRRHKQVLDVLKSSSASLKTIQFRLNSNARNPWELETVQGIVEDLQKKKLAVYYEKGHRYAIRESLHNEANLTLEQFTKDSRTLTFVIKSCWHVGALKALYFTVLKKEPELADDADVIVLNGDVQQGISHNYEYNGEMLATMNGPDKHQSAAAIMQAIILLDIFRRRWARLVALKLPTKEMLQKCLVTFVYNVGNHDESRFSKSKDAIALHIFDLKLRSEMVMLLTAFLQSENRASDVRFDELVKLINEKIIRVGESRTIKVSDAVIGLKHPRQGNTQNKGARIQQTASFFEKALAYYPDRDLKQLCVVMVANFHEASSIHTSHFGKTILGVMSAAMLKDTEFENNINKAVEHGMVKVSVQLNKQGQLLSDTIEFFDDIVPEDAKFVFADNLTTAMVLERCKKVDELTQLPWR
ncbi:MAG: hypothetical protein HZB99_03000 [Candidatus Harrisonbacteria bacterium]|nr:hypothetical protein [Candidatus Harrisonbacteria bacterium]